MAAGAATPFRRRVTAPNPKSESAKCQDRGESTMFTHVDKPIVIRNIEIKNRVVRSAATSILGAGTISEDLIAYHEARARGGVGLSVLDIMNIHPSSRIPINSFDPRMGDVYPPMIQRLKAHGMRVFQ